MNEELLVGYLPALQPPCGQDNIVQFFCDNRCNSTIAYVTRLDKLDKETSVPFCSTVLQGAFNCQFLGKEADKRVKHKSACPNLRAVEQRQAIEIDQPFIRCGLITVTRCHRSLY